MALPPPIVIPPERLHDLADAASLEWLETDGRGGYAASTAAGVNTRRYHGLLVVARQPPADRVVLLSRLEETVVDGRGTRWELGVNYYPGAVHPQGHRWLAEFRLDPWPVWRWRLGALTLTKAVLFSREAGALLVLYRLRGGSARLELRPFIAGRGFHALVHENPAVWPRAEAVPGRVHYAPYEGIPALVLSHDAAEWRHAGEWYRQTLYPRETERGMDDREDLYLPGFLAAELADGGVWRVACATEPVETQSVPALAAAERDRRERLARRGREAAHAAADTDLGARLAVAADDFVVRRGAGLSILAGYPWFADWGRDAMIALPGLLLATGRTADAASVLHTFAAHLRDGLIPNRFPEGGGPIPDDHYNAADAPLWFVEAVAALADAGGDAGPLWPAVRAILDAYRAGTRFGIGMDTDGLVRQGAPGVQLTWMDARVDGWVVTPRAGRPVEVNGLWHNALRRAGALAAGLGEEGADYLRLAERVRAAFEVFWYPGGGYLYDGLDEAGRPDPALRPNQLIALALPASPVGDVARARSVVDACARALLVPLGVRTLDPAAPGYLGRYAGDRRARDAAYHNGTAWPWLLGPLLEAARRAYGGTGPWPGLVADALARARDHLGAYGLGHIAEVLDGDAPHAPGGCFAQAWSCAALLRACTLRSPAGHDPDRPRPVDLSAPPG